MYAIDYGDGYEVVFPDGYGLHMSGCSGEECNGCWYPGGGDDSPWFDSLREGGAALRARAGTREEEFQRE